jgi:hypothetical protein
MIDTVPSRLEVFFDWLGPKVKRALKRAKKRWRRKPAPRRKARKKRAAKPVVYADNVVPFPRQYRRR